MESRLKALGLSHLSILIVEISQNVVTNDFQFQHVYSKHNPLFMYASLIVTLHSSTSSTDRTPQGPRTMLLSEIVEVMTPHHV